MLAILIKVKKNRRVFQWCSYDSSSNLKIESVHLIQVDTCVQLCILQCYTVAIANQDIEKE